MDLQGITADLARQIVNKYDNFGITYDLSHVIQLKEDVEHSLIKLHDYTNHIHIANCVINDKLSSFLVISIRRLVLKEVKYRKRSSFFLKNG